MIQDLTFIPGLGILIIPYGGIFEGVENEKL